MVSLPEPVATAIASWLAAHDVVAPGVIEGLYVVGSAALDDWMPRSDIDVVAVVADPSDSDLADDLAEAQALVRERVGLSIDGPHVAWGDLVVPAMAVPRPWVLDVEERRAWVAENLDTYWRGVGEALATGLAEGTEDEWGGEILEWVALGVARMPYTFETGDVVTWCRSPRRVDGRSSASRGMPTCSPGRWRSAPTRAW